MKATLTFTQLGQMSAIELSSMLTKYKPHTEQYKMVAYEIRIRKVELPESWKLN